MHKEWVGIAHNAAILSHHDMHLVINAQTGLTL